jgi:nicotinate-nucleotide adenylyltransferase
MEIAVFGGTFDPPTLAHEAIIDACLEHEALDEVWLLPSYVRRDKMNMSSDTQRLNLLRTLCATRFMNNPRVKINDYEVRRRRLTETWLTAAVLETLHPRDRLWWVYGADSYQDMPTWEHGDLLRGRLNFLLIPREGYDLPEPSERIGHLAVNACALGISSTLVREAAATTQSLHGLVSPAVNAFITDHRLYQREML